ncbi:hypothetical protein GZ77_23990 [Endozoicomonas montiporae]|uniref:Secreted protein n=2 Tax=Endozoicomonas montiporae TaxID=1027273 RepID=A0A081MZG4_9GAMM|nr:hypothetical protein [Endozoicomonas montiporae]AMO54730.1 hypothetical protein EZMO1_0479 [Endozoicomonas montiporae CL-33]KEQ11587.1 hypothetical protein GZ77_23990 [Endozoicomonas montiporae]
MMRITRLFSTTLLFLLSNSALADALHPLCLDRFAELERGSGIRTMTSLDLRACQKKYAHLPVDQKSPWLASFNATSITTGTREEETEVLPAFAAYNLIGQMENEQVLVKYVVNYGGSGTFTFGFLFKGLDLDSFPVLDEALAGKKRSANLELVQSFSGGDRCSGGITDLHIVAPDKVSVTRYMTPYELVTLGVSEKQQAKSYGDLPDCAICCVGEFTKIINLNGHGKLMEVRLTGISLEQEKEHSKQQTCLADLVDARGKNLILNRKQLEDLQAAYTAECTKSNKHPRATD